MGKVPFEMDREYLKPFLAIRFRLKALYSVRVGDF